MMIARMYCENASPYRLLRSGSFPNDMKDYLLRRLEIYCGPRDGEDRRTYRFCLTKDRAHFAYLSMWARHLSHEVISSIRVELSDVDADAQVLYLASILKTLQNQP